ncbi:ClbS/DfsB family four-helix bundle protein [Planktotalea sp.]|uniref:ClbS/DfsB family four-helix bundle protein n=1 Tax=Planktotalea sp. TaxID=2029877 RepID=UPI003D6A04D6
MPAATNKADLLKVTQKEFAKLEALMDSVSPELAMHKEEDISIKDVIAHRAHWVGLFLGWHRDGQAGKQVYFPAKGYKWNDLPSYNAALRAEQKDVDWQEACEMIAKAHNALLSFIDVHSDEALYGGPMRGANNKWTTGRWAEAAGPSHYRSAAKYLRSFKRAWG